MTKRISFCLDFFRIGKFYLDDAFQIINGRVAIKF